MILYFENAEKFALGIAELAPELGIETSCKDNADICVTVEETDEDGVEVTLKDNCAQIRYGGHNIRFFRGLGLLCEALTCGRKEFYKKEEPKFITNGSMFDVARNMVFKPEMLKAILRKQAMMGLNFFMLYLEDLFEVPEYPYFGHMRGRYSKDELREIDAYGQIFGIEVVPAIQCLGHSVLAIQWEAMAHLRDTHNILMVGNEEVYKFIDKMMETISECFTTKRLHIGMDEARNMGFGRYRENNEIRPQFELFCEHIERIKQIAEKYKFNLMVWSDMFFSMVSKGHYNLEAEFGQKEIELVPDDIQLVYWKYCVFDPAEHEKLLKMHYKLSDDIVYAGGIQTWLGPVPLYDVSIHSARAALTNCIRNGVKEVMATSWANGGDCTLIFALYGLMIYAEMDYNGEYDEKTIKERFRYICGIEADDIIDLEKMNFPGGKFNYEEAVEEDYVKTSKYLLFNDPLIGLMDKNIEGVDARTYYSNLYEELKNRGTDDGLFGPAFKYVKSFLWVLILKADYGVRLKKAYDERNMAELDALYEDAKELQKRFDEFRKVTREFYMYYNKPFGYEVLDMRLGTMIMRFDTVCYNIDKLKADPDYRIAELEEERMYLIRPEDAKRVTLMEYDFGRFFSSCIVYGVASSADSFYIG